MSEVRVPVSRLTRWLDNFSERHGEATLEVDAGSVLARAADGSHATCHLPWARDYTAAAATAGPAPRVWGSQRADALVADFVDHATPPADWGVLLVRKGGFAVARMHGDTWHASKTGQRHVQGRTKAGGQSQQRFARRRDNQARAAYAAAADHAHRLLDHCPVLVTGGDHQAVDEVLADARLRALANVVVPPWLAVADPRRAVLEKAVTDAGALRIDVHNA